MFNRVSPILQIQRSHTGAALFQQTLVLRGIHNILLLIKHTGKGTHNALALYALLMAARLMITRHIEVAVSVSAQRFVVACNLSK